MSQWAGDLLGHGRGRRDRVQAGVLVPGARHPVGDERRRHRAADDEPEVARTGARDQAAIGAGDEPVEHLPRIGRAVRERSTEGGAKGREIDRPADRSVVQRRQVLDGQVGGSSQELRVGTISSDMGRPPIGREGAQGTAPCYREGRHDREHRHGSRVVPGLARSIHRRLAPPRSGRHRRPLQRRRALRLRPVRRGRHRPRRASSPRGWPTPTNRARGPPTTRCSRSTATPASPMDGRAISRTIARRSIASSPTSSSAASTTTAVAGSSPSTTCAVVRTPSRTERGRLAGPHPAGVRSSSDTHRAPSPAR